MLWATHFSSGRVGRYPVKINFLLSIKHYNFNYKKKLKNCHLTKLLTYKFNDWQIGFNF